MDPAAIRVADDIKSVLGITKEIGIDQVEVISAVRLEQRSNINALECCLLKSSPGQSS